MDRLSSRSSSTAIFTLAGLAACALWALGGAASARQPAIQDETPLVEGITVVGRADYSRKAERATIAIELSATDELPATALHSLNADAQRLLASMGDVAGGKVMVQRQGPSFEPAIGSSVQQIMMGEVPSDEDEPQKIQAAETVLLQVSEPGADGSLADLVAEAIGSALDSGARLAGAKVGDDYFTYLAAMSGQREETSRPSVEFRTGEMSEAADEALGAAVADARRRADRLATLSGVRLGPVRAIEELAAPHGTLNSAGPQLQEVRVRVRFAILP